jgi:hypothetical protein
MEKVIEMYLYIFLFLTSFEFLNLLEHNRSGKCARNTVIFFNGIQAAS